MEEHGLFGSSSEEDEPEIAHVKIGKIVHIPAKVFPRHKPPKVGYWVGKLVQTQKGGLGDVGIRIEGEKIFTRPKHEVVNWLIS